MFINRLFKIFVPIDTLHYTWEVVCVYWNKFVYLNKHDKYKLKFPHCKGTPLLVTGYTHYGSQWYILELNPSDISTPAYHHFSTF